ncbi:hypothetical protein F2Q69_00054528 [Brassica cretica]|uniref:Leucine-rich repeat-containing N-terminal plant-type domain-containing protein n=1 Tax=Brassica cretica TaxID=69181 RepID=A0A8S9MVP3_BRACR|nr:hypothetical protein F2Q69_00054528 [Brassica cretica]
MEATPYLLFLLFTVSLLAVTTADDRAAMLALAKSFTPPPSDWSTTSSTGCCTWSGVRCTSESDRVTSISLEDESLAGDLAPEVSTLSELKSINLQGNKLSDPRPLLQQHHRRFASLPGQIFDQNDQFSGLSGTIQVLSGMTSLSQAWLQKNQFTGSIPKVLTSLPNLQLIDLSNNNLTGDIPMFPATVAFIYKPGNLLLVDSSGPGTASDSNDDIFNLVGMGLLLLVFVILSKLDNDIFGYKDKARDFEKTQLRIPASFRRKTVNLQMMASGKTPGLTQEANDRTYEAKIDRDNNNTDVLDDMKQRFLVFKKHKLRSSNTRRNQCISDATAKVNTSKQFFFTLTAGLQVHQTPQGWQLLSIKSLSLSAGSKPGDSSSRKLGSYLIQSQFQCAGNSSALFLTVAAQNLLFSWFKAASHFCLNVMKSYNL